MGNRRYSEWSRITCLIFIHLSCGAFFRSGGACLLAIPWQQSQVSDFSGIIGKEPDLLWMCLGILFIVQELAVGMKGLMLSSLAGRVKLAALFSTVENLQSIKDTWPC